MTSILLRRSLDILFVIPGFLLLIPSSSFCQQGQKRKRGRERYEPARATKVDIKKHLEIFDTNDGRALFFISLCADVPYNKKPLKVAYKQQTGHVFVILQEISGSDTIQRVFGYYPKKGLPVLLFKRIKAVIKDNSYREYDVSISRELSAKQFDQALRSADDLSKRPYHINKFNCYDYAVTVFNRAVETDTVKLVKVRFPFIFGKGGSPCGLYQELMEKKMEADKIAAIRVGEYRAPPSTGFARENYMAGGGND